MDGAHLSGRAQQGRHEQGSHARGGDPAPGPSRRRRAEILVLLGWSRVGRRTGVPALRLRVPVVDVPVAFLPRGKVVTPELAIEIIQGSLPSV